jgi:hypothetical protein
MACVRDYSENPFACLLQKIVTKSPVRFSRARPKYNSLSKFLFMHLFSIIFFAAISRFPLYLFGKETAKKDAASIGANDL